MSLLLGMPVLKDSTRARLLDVLCNRDCVFQSHCNVIEQLNFVGIVIWDSIEGKNCNEDTDYIKVG